MIEGLLPPSSRDDPLDARRRGGLNRPAGRDRAGERDRVHLRVGDDSRPDRLAGPLDDVEDAGRDPCLECEFRHDDRAHRRLLGGLQDDAVAGAQSEQPEGGGGGGTVPGNDRSDDTDRLANLLDGELVRDCGDRAVELARPARVVLESVDGELDDEPGVHPQQARVDHIEVRQLVLVLGEQGGELAKAPFLLERREVAPAAVVECLACGLDCPVDVGRRARGGRRDLLPGGGVDHRHRAAVERWNELTIDHVAEQGTIKLPGGRRRDRISGGISQHTHGLTVSPCLRIHPRRCGRFELTSVQDNVGCRLCQAAWSIGLASACTEVISTWDHNRAALELAALEPRVRLDGLPEAYPLDLDMDRA